MSMLSRHQRTLSTHARFVNPCLGFKSRKKKLQLKRTHLHQQCWTRRLHACSPRRVRARRSRSAWRDRNPCSPARRSLPRDAPGTWTENSDETQSQSREFKRNIFQRAHDNSYLLTSVWQCPSTCLCWPWSPLCCTLWFPPEELKLAVDCSFLACLLLLSLALTRPSPVNKTWRRSLGI